VSYGAGIDRELDAAGIHVLRVAFRYPFHFSSRKYPSSWHEPIVQYLKSGSRRVPTDHLYDAGSVRHNPMTPVIPRSNCDRCGVE
jgi:hypothetical protein